jgi:hypothetical protein
MGSSDPSGTETTRGSASPAEGGGVTGATVAGVEGGCDVSVGVHAQRATRTVARPAVREGELFTIPAVARGARGGYASPRASHPMPFGPGAR